MNNSVLIVVGVSMINKLRLGVAKIAMSVCVCACCVCVCVCGGGGGVLVRTSVFVCV